MRVRTKRFNNSKFKPATVDFVVAGKFTQLYLINVNSELVKQKRTLGCCLDNRPI